MRDSYFDVTTKDAVESILKDATKPKDTREEDAEFVRRLRRNEYVAFGSFDVEEAAKAERAFKRQQQQLEREEMEAKRKRVREIDL